MNKAAVLYIFVFLISLTGFAQKEQNDTVLFIDEIAISSDKLQVFSSCNSVYSVDKTLIKNNTQKTLSDLLSQSGLSDIKSYGTASIASVSLRGTGNSHTVILWNGLNLQNSCSGGSNIALIPVFFLDKIKIQLGGTTSSFGSGSIGGTIHLENNQIAKEGFSSEILASYGSFSSHSEGISLALKKKKFSTRLRIINSASENDFSYINTAKFSNPQLRLENAKTQNTGILNEYSFNISKKQEITSHFWYQSSNSGVPANMLNEKSEAFRDDISFRSSIIWKFETKKFKFQYRNGFISDDLLYKDNSVNLVSRIVSENLINEAEITGNLGIFKLNAGLSNIYESGKTENFSGNKKRIRTSGFVSLKFENKQKNLVLEPTIRQETVFFKPTPFTWSFGSEYKISKSFSVKSVFSKNYKLPSFNDLYWQSWGNPDLLPETAICKDLGLRYEKQTKNIEYTFDLTYFDNRINNLIIWIPQAEIWTPQNIKKVHSSGLETKINISKSIREYIFNVSGSYSFTKSVNEFDISEELIGKQLIYIPLHKANLILVFSYKGFEFQYSNSFTGKRFYTSDNSKELSSYVLGNVSITKNFKISTDELIINLSVNNIYNSVYQLTAWFPMPGIHYNLSAVFKF